MAGLALAIDLLTTTTIVSKGLHSFFTLSALTATAAASSRVSYLGLGSSSPGSLFAHFDARDWAGRVAYCDAAMVEESEETIQCVPIRTNKLYPAGKKKYDIELEPLFSAFRPKAICATTIKAVLLNSLPLLEAYLLQPEDDEFKPEDLDRPARPWDPMDAVGPFFKRSVTHIVPEVSVNTARRILARVVVRHVTDRTAWKLLKDIPKSATRKAGRGNLSPAEMFAAVCKTTFRAHVLGVLANWMVQLIMDFCGNVCVVCTERLKAGKRVGLDSKELKCLARRTAGETLKRSASLVLASVVAGLGTVFIGSSTGTWIGCFAGDLAGPFLVGPWLDTWIVYGTFTPGGLDNGQ